MRVVVERVSKVYADRAGHTLRALDGIDLVVDAEEFVAVLGPSGCGKSTLLNLIAGLLAPSEGECGNLAVPVCLSATHIAYGSIRMEPVFMILGQSTATAG